jgi:hypothetical protein
MRYLIILLAALTLSACASAPPPRLDAPGTCPEAMPQEACRR